MIKVKDLVFSYTGIPLFNKASFAVSKGQKVGLVGPNGSGKTTLLNLLNKKEQISEGKIEVVGSIDLVPQEVKYDPILEASQNIRCYLDKDNQKPDFELKKMLHDLGLSDLSLSSSPKRLSGGQKTKLALVRALLVKPDTLCLDEPTNFMDDVGKKWVMNFLSTYPKTLILISHDLELLDKYVDKVIAINPQTKKIEEYKGNYSKFVKLKEEKEALLKRRVIAKQKHIVRMNKGLIKLYRLRSKKGVRQRVMLQRKIEKEKEILPELPRELKKMKVRLPEPARVGELPFRVHGVSKSYGQTKVLDGLSFYVLRGERIALIGPNGAGKSTLVRIIVGDLEPDSGEVIRAANLKIGYYSQEFASLNLNKTLLETVMEDCHQPEKFARHHLAQFLLSKDNVIRKVASLSGGEKTRFAIALLTAHDYNLLVLDEPTTYLDVLSQRIILEALKEYCGTMVVISHTEEFVAELKPERALLLPEGKFVFWSKELLNMVGEI